MEILAYLVLLASFATALKAPGTLPLISHGYTFSRLQTSDRPKKRSPLKVVDNVIELKRGAATAISLSARYLQALRADSKVGHGPYSRVERTSGSAPLVNLEAGAVFVAPITVGGQNFYAVIDTGSSDPWLVETNFDCIDPQTGAPAYGGDADCEFGPLYNPAQSSTYRNIPNQNFNITYADNEQLNGLMGYESYTMGGVTVPNQKFGMVNYAAWYGDGTSSGLVGFAYSTLTSAYAGTNPKADSRGQSLMYPTLFTNMYTSQGVPPVFSMAMSRDPNNGGVMALGGIPNIPHSPYFASVPIIPVGVNQTDGSLVYEFYTIQIGGFVYSSSRNTQYNPYGTQNRLKQNTVLNGTNIIVDSGTSLVYVPNSVAAGVAAAFSPAATYDNNAEAYYVDCNAVAPTFGVNIAGKVFYVNPADLILPSTPGSCIMGVQPNMGGLSILGDVWMKSVLCVFDIGAEEMRFAAREYYGLTSTQVHAHT